MKKTWLKVGAVLAVAAFTATVQAVPITGSINFQGGTATLNGSISSGAGGATAITSFDGSPTVNNAANVGPTGSFAGTGGDAVTFISSGFTFSPSLSPNPVNPLWTFTANGVTYSFILESVESSIGVGPTLNLAGTGLFEITGGNTDYDNTLANWTFSTTGTGPATFGFVAGNTAAEATVPDGGTTVILLGAALSGLAAPEAQIGRLIDL